MQRTGIISHGDIPVAVGYSGAGEQKNDPAAQGMAGLGPIPQGVYWIGLQRDTAEHGPAVLPLIPVLPGCNTLGRSGFLIHGDSIASPGTASRGCIILPRAVRDRIAASGEKLLVVLSGDSPTEFVA